MGSKVVVAALSVAALAASAGAGAYLATKRADSAVDRPAFVDNQAAGPGVEGTEGVIDEAPAVGKPAVGKDVPPTAKAEPPEGVAVPRPAAVPTPVRPAPKPAAKPAAAPRRPAPAPRTVTPRPEPPLAAERTPVPAAVARESESARVNAPAPIQDRPADTTAREEWPASREERQPTDPLPTVPRFEEVTIPADAVIGLQLDSTVSSDTARIEDRVTARVTRDVRAGGQVAIPAGARVVGSVSDVDRGGKMRERARIGVRFHTIVLADGTELALQTETVLREGESPGNASAAKVGGGAIGGAILGAILGGGKGAAIGAGVGAGAGTAAVMAGGRRPAQIQAGTPLTVKVLSPISIEVER